MSDRLSLAKMSMMGRGLCVLAELPTKITKGDFCGLNWLFTFGAYDCAKRKSQLRREGLARMARKLGSACHAESLNAPREWGWPWANFVCRRGFRGTGLKFHTRPVRGSIVQHAAKAVAPLDLAGIFQLACLWAHESAGQALIVALAVIVQRQ